MFLEKNAGQHFVNSVRGRNSLPPTGELIIPRFSTLLPGLQQKKRNSRRQFLLLLLASALVVATVLVIADVQKVGTALTVQLTNQSAIQIDLDQGLPISPYLLGSNVFPESGTSAKDAGGEGFMSYSPAVVDGLRSAGIKLLRFPGGNWGEQHTPSLIQLNAFSALLNQVGAEGFMQVQLSDPLDKPPVSLQTRATRAALLVEYMNNAQSIQRQGTNAHAPFHPIKYWSIGNEPDLLTDPDTGLKYTVKEYTQAFIAYSLAMHQKDPSIKIFGPELSQYGVNGGPRDRTGQLWMQGFLAGVSAYEYTHDLPFQLLNGISFHFYPFGEHQGSTSAVLSNAQQWATILPALRQMIRQSFGEDLPVAVTEISVSSGSAEPAPNVSALWWAETLGALLNNQVEYVAYFSTEGVDSPYPLFFQKGLSQTAMLRVMQLFAQLQGNLIPIQSQVGSVRVFATQDSGTNTVSLLFLNSTTEDQHLRVYADTGTIPLFSPWQSANLTLQGYDMAVLTLHRHGTNQVFSFNNRLNE